MLERGIAYRCYMRAGRARCDARAADARAARSRATTAPGARSRARRCRRCPKACSRWCAFATRSTATSRWDDMVKGRIDVQQRRARRPGHRAARTARRPTTSAWWSTTGHAHHARDPRRRPREQHAAPDQHPARARRTSRRCTRTCPCAQRARARRCRKRHGAKPRDAIPRRGLPARSDGQLPGAPGLEPWRRRDLLARAIPRSGSTSITSAAAPAQFDEASCAGSTRSYLKAMADDARLRRWCAAQLAQARHRRADRRRWPRRLRAVQGPLRTRRSSWPTGCMLFYRRCAADARTSRTARDRRGASRRSRLADKLAVGRLGQGCDRRGDQGSARRAQA